MKKFVCFFIIASLLIPMFFIETSAGDLHKIPLTDLITEYEVVSCSPNLNKTENAQSYYYNFGEGDTRNLTYTAYSLLDDCQKLIYNKLVSAEIGTISYTLEFKNGEFLYSDYQTQGYLSAVMYAVSRDHPEIFYFHGYSISGGYFYSGNKYIKSLNFNMIVNSKSTYTQANIKSYYNAMMNMVKNAPVDLSNRYNFVKSVHDYISLNAYYPDLNSSAYTYNCHDAYGALVQGICVCEGYSEAFKLICDYYKIPTVCLTGLANGGAHMWNAALMDDGKWYYLDVTWDDYDSDNYGIFTDFFLVGSSTKDSHFTGGAFSASHVEDDLTYIPPLNYATTKYSQTQHNTAFKATYNSLAKTNGRYLVRSYFDADDSYVYYNGIYVDTEGLTTSGTFNVPSGNNGANQSWSLVLLGDCNGDGSCDALDYSDAVNKVLSQQNVTNAYDMAADIDCDGYLDVIDLSLLQLVTSGIDTNIVIEK